MSAKSKAKAAPLLGVRHAARELDLSEKRVRELCDKGSIPHIRDSEGRRLFLHADIEAAKARRR